MEVRSFDLPVFDYLSLLPYITLALTGMFGLIVHMVKPKGTSNLLFLVTLVGVFLALACQTSLLGHDTIVLEMLYRDKSGLVGELLVLVCTLVVLLITNPYFKKSKIHCPEFYPLLCWASLGGMVMCVANNLLALFVGLELLSISLYVLAGIHKRSKFSQEAALKYFLLGAFATGFFLYGVAFLYGATGALNFEAFLYRGNGQETSSRLLIDIGFVMIMVGLCFKCGLAPFHQWVPDVYSGAPTNVVAFMATGAKIGPFFAIYHIIAQCYLLRDIAYPVLLVVSVLSLVLGNAMAFTQKDIKKLMAYSSIVNAGYIGLYFSGLVKASGVNYYTLDYFLLGYVFATLGVFVILTLASRDGDEDSSLKSLHGLSTRHPILAGLLVVFVLSQIGIGPVAGFVGKVMIVTDMVQLEHPWLAVFLVANSAFGAFYYFKLIRAAYTKENDLESPRYELTTSIKSALAICAIGVVGSVIFYSPLVVFLVGKR